MATRAERAAGRRGGAVWSALLPMVLVSSLSGLVVSAFYAWINPVIEARREQEVIELGLRSIFPEAARMGRLEGIAVPEGVEGPVYEVYGPQGERLGQMYYVTGQGWNAFRLAVGVDAATQRVVGVRVLDHQETPGLGSRITEDWFLAQFKGKPLSDPFQAGQDVEAITGATVSTRGVARTVAESARSVLEAMGVTVEVPAAAEGVVAVGAASGSAALKTPAYAVKVREALGVEVAMTPADVWRVEDEDGRMIAWAVRVEERGYGGPVAVLTLVDPEEPAVRAVEVLSHNETPGLGDAIAEAFFLAQFAGRGPTDAIEVGVDIDAVTMATASSSAVARAVKRAVAAVAALSGDGGGR